MGQRFHERQVSKKVSEMQQNSNRHFWSPHDVSDVAVGEKITKVNEVQLLLSETQACWKQVYIQALQCRC